MLLLAVSLPLVTSFGAKAPTLRTFCQYYDHQRKVSEHLPILHTTVHAKGRQLELIPVLQAQLAPPKLQSAFSFCRQSARPLAFSEPDPA